MLQYFKKSVVTGTALAVGLSLASIGHAASTKPLSGVDKLLTTIVSKSMIKGGLEKDANGNLAMDVNGNFKFNFTGDIFYPVTSPMTGQSTLPDYATLKSEHARFHGAAATVVAKADAGGNTDEDTMLGGKSDYSSASNNVISAIMKMKRKAEYLYFKAHQALRVARHSLLKFVPCNISDGPGQRRNRCA